jgi:DNA-directed RNA polymerase subunit beta'
MVTGVKDLGKEKIITVLPDVTDTKKTKKGASEIEYKFHYRRMPLVKVGDHVKQGDIITDGSAEIDDVFKYAGVEKAKEYVIQEVGKIYELQGETVSRKHIEIIVRQMFSRYKVDEPGSSTLTEGEVVDDIILSEHGKDVKAEAVVMGITEVSLSRKSWLSAASFQHTNRVLINSALKGSEDVLGGLMENVIIGRHIPAGTGYKGSPKYKLMETVAPDKEEENQ